MKQSDRLKLHREVELITGINLSMLRSSFARGWGGRAVLFGMGGWMSTFHLAGVSRGIAGDKTEQESFAEFVAFVGETEG